jgi:4-hydroxybenzoate polyprenyltransferase
MSYSRSSTLRHALSASVWWAHRLSVVQGIVAAAKTVFVMALLGITAPAAPIAVALVSFGVYAANDLADADEDAINCPGRASLVSRRPLAIGLLAAAAVLAAAVLALLAGGPVALGVTSVPVLAALLYSVPVPGHRRLKDVFAVNTLLVSTAWAVTVTGLPVALAGAPVDGWTIAVCLLLCLRSVVSVELFNVRDVAGDTAAGVRTLPVVLGVARTRQVLAGVDVLSVAVLLAVGLWSAAGVVALAAVPVVCGSFGLLWAVGRSDRIEPLCLAKDVEYLLLGTVGLLAL